jgi:hypothetical protein
MDNVEEQILAYPHLPMEEQRALESYVEDHPEWASLLHDVRALETLTPNGVGEASEISEGVLVTYALARYLHDDAVPTSLAPALERVEERVENDESLRARIEAMENRIEAAEAAVDPQAQFEELTGHTLSDVGGDASSAPDTVAETEKESASFTALLDALLGLPRAARLGMAAVVALIGLYGGLLLASSASQSTLDRMAAVEVSSQMVESYYDTTTRSAVPTDRSDTQDAGALYLDALATLRNARSSTLGLFPEYAPDSLEQAATRLRGVLQQTDDGAFLALEARFYLAKAQLAQGRVDAARANLKRVVEQEGRQADAAYEMLRTLQEEYPEGSSADM